MKILTLCLFLTLLSLPAAGQAPQVSAGASLARPDSTATDSLVRLGTDTATDQNKIKIVKRKISYKEYLLLAVGMMVFIGLVLTTTQRWNPE
jgi:hypothetical protein